MSQELNAIKAAQEWFNQCIQEINSAWAKDELFLQRQRLFNQEKNKILQLDAFELKPTWFNYDTVLRALQACIEAILKSLKQPDLSSRDSKKQKISLQLYLLELIPLLDDQRIDECTNEIETQDKKDKNEDFINLLQRLQKVMDLAFNELVPEKEKFFSINLANLKNEYEQAYTSQHGTGIWRFFKCLFRQSSRNDELTFLEDVDTYLKGADVALLPANKETIKLNALSLVRFKINTERYGKNSLLKRLIESRIEDSCFSSHEDTEIMEDFINSCKTMNITVPKCLTTILENNSITAIPVAGV